MAKVTQLYLVVVAVVVLAFLPLPAAEQQQLPSTKLDVSSHFDLGHQVGQRFAARIRAYFERSNILHKVLLPLVQNATGKALFNKFVTTSRLRYPLYYDEIRGISEGSGVSLEWILLVSLQDELIHFDGARPHTPDASEGIPGSALSCSDVMVNDHRGLMLGHNEDSGSLTKEYAYMVIVNLQSNNKRVPDESFTFYNYPGLLPGNAWGFNKHGMAMSLNAVFPKDIVEGGIGRAFINRDIIDATSIDDAIRRATPLGRAGGFSLNVASIHERRVVNVEVSPFDYSVRDIIGNYSHFNMYRTLDIPQYVDPSSVHRLERINEMTAPTDAQGILNILGDTKDKQYPIYRDGVAPDDGVTVATVLFDIDQHTATIWVKNPKLTKPLMHLSLN